MFHWDWLTEVDSEGKLKNISGQHPIFLSRLVTSGIVTRLKSSVIGNITTGRCNVTGMSATGVPPHIELHRQNELLREQVKRLEEQLLNQHIEVMERLPTLVTEQVLSNVRVEGVQQLSRNDMEDLISGLVQKYTAQLVVSPPSTSPELITPTTASTQGGHPSYHWIH